MKYKVTVFANIFIEADSEEDALEQAAWLRDGLDYNLDLDYMIEELFESEPGDIYK